MTLELRPEAISSVSAGEGGEAPDHSAGAGAWWGDPGRPRLGRFPLLTNMGVTLGTDMVRNVLSERASWLLCTKWRVD